jgi:hypothetical protein
MREALFYVRAQREVEVKGVGIIEGGNGDNKCK